MKTKEVAKHTPGPWTFGGARERKTGDRLVMDRENNPVASAIDYNEYAKDDQVDANARLIAASPDLLREANKALSFLECMRDRVAGLTQHYKIEVEEDLRAAIKKAEGW